MSDSGERLSWGWVVAFVLGFALAVMLIVNYREEDCRNKGGHMDWGHSICLSADDRLIR